MHCSRRKCNTGRVIQPRDYAVSRAVFRKTMRTILLSIARLPMRKPNSRRVIIAAMRAALREFRYTHVSRFARRCINRVERGIRQALRESGARF